MIRFQLDIFVHQANETELEKKLEFIGDSLVTLAAQSARMARELAKLRTDPAALNALADSLDAKAADLAATVAANAPNP